MSYLATVLKVMIASPGDVSQERQITRNVIAEWNAIHSEDRKVALMPVGWETHASPEMGDRPQAIINKQILKDCDLLVAIFWTRLGSPTGEAASGTVEEIEEHLRAGKPAIIYFSSAPVRPDSVDNEQYTALLEFKKSCRERGLVEEYESLEQFHDLFSRHLAQTVIRSFSSGESSDVPESEPATAPGLSGSAQELLLVAAGSSDGTVIRVGTMGGTVVQAGGRNFVQPDDPRSDAKWRGSVDELQSLGLVEDRAGKGEVFFVTDAGYAAADMLGGGSSA